MEGLPPELKSNILSRLPVESLLQCRCVCKTWRALIDDPFLRETHTERLLLHLDNHHGGGSSSDYGTVSFLFLVRFRGDVDYKLQFVDYYYYDDEQEDSYWPRRPMDYLPFETLCFDGIIGSCNGLVCLRAYDRNMFDHIYVFNPVTRECLNFPSLYKGTFGMGTNPHGFGYHPCTKEYKVVQIHFDGKVHKVDVYTLGSGEWRSRGAVPSMFSFLYPSVGVLSYGALNWIDGNGMIASFDLATEEFSVVPSPSGVIIDSGVGRYCRLGVWRKSLCLIKYDVLKSIQIWVMKNGEQSWRKEIDISLEDDDFPYDLDWKDVYRFITLAGNGIVLFWYNRDKLMSYDPVNGRFTTLDLNGTWSSFNAVLHTNSFVSMKALGENTKIIG